MTRPAATPAERAYLALVADYQTAILNFLYRLVGDMDLAEDLTQETYIKAFRALERLELAPEAAPRRRAWLYRIAHNTATDYLRRQGHLRWLTLDAARHRSAEVTHDPAEAEPVRQALARIGPEHRQVLLLFTYVGLDANEVGEVLGITAEAARKRRQRAREAFEAAYAALVGATP